MLVTQRVGEIPATFTHVLLLRDGRVPVAGPLQTALTGEALSGAFGLPLRVDQRDGRYTAWNVTD